MSKCRISCLHYICLPEVFNNHIQPVSCVSNQLLGFFCSQISVSATAPKIPYWITSEYAHRETNQIKRQDGRQSSSPLGAAQNANWCQNLLNVQISNSTGNDVNLWDTAGLQLISSLTTDIINKRLLSPLICLLVINGISSSLSLFLKFMSKYLQKLLPFPCNLAVHWV